VADITFARSGHESGMIVTPLAIGLETLELVAVPDVDLVRT